MKKSKHNADIAVANSRNIPISEVKAKDVQTSRRNIAWYDDMLRRESNITITEKKAAHAFEVSCRKIISMSTQELVKHSQS